MELTKRVLRAIYIRTWDVIEELNVRLGSWQSREVFVVVVRVGHVCSLNWVMTLHWYIRGKVEDDRSMIDAEIALFIQVRTYYVRTPPHINQSSGKHYLENNDVCSTNLFIQMSFCFLIWLRLRHFGSRDERSMMISYSGMTTVGFCIVSWIEQPPAIYDLY